MVFATEPTYVLDAMMKLIQHGLLTVVEFVLIPPMSQLSAMVLYILK